MIFDTNLLKDKILKKLSVLDEASSPSKIVINNPQNVILGNNDSSSNKYEDEDEETVKSTKKKSPVDTSSTEDSSTFYNDEEEVLSLASDPSVDDDKIVDIPKYEDEEISPSEPSENDVLNMAMDPSINDDEITDPPSMLNPNIPSYEDEFSQDVAPQTTPVDPNTQQPPFYNDEEQIDPNTGMPIQQTSGAIDPVTGMPMQQPQIDPVTGMPMQQIDPVTGMPIDPYSDDVNPEMTVGNSSEVVKGAPIPLEDISRIEELKIINSQLMQIRQILEKELNNKYNKVEDKVIEAVNYFRSIIANLDSFSAQIDDIIHKFKRFILAVLTEINTIKDLELNGEDDKLNNRKEDDTTSNDKNKSSSNTKDKSDKTNKK